jgi:hypothetical protein
MATSGSDHPDENDWNVALHITQGEKTNRLGGFGMHPLATAGLDWFDNFNPPRFLDVPEVNFKNTEAPDILFSNDVVKSQDEHVWTFTPAGKLGEKARLTWNADLHSAKQLFLLDEKQLNIVDMTSETQYDFMMTSSSSFRIFYGQDVEKKINASRIVASDPYPNPVTAENKSSITLALPENNSEYAVSLQIFNGQGEEMGRLDRKLSPGIYPLDFSMGSASGAGIYVYKLAVSNDKTSALYTGKIIKP